MYQNLKKIFIACCLLLLSMHCHAQATVIGGTINIYTPVLAIDTNGCPSVITVSSTVGFSIGDKVLIIQMKGCNFDSSNTSSFGSVVAINGAGNYEIAQITAIAGNSVSLNGKLTRLFNISGKVQMVRIPTYTNAVVSSMLTCNAWNGSTGGVLILDVTGNLSLGANVNVVGKGFRGGAISTNPDGACGTGSLGYFYPLTQAGSPWTTGGAEKGEGIGVVSAGKLAGRGALVTGGGGGNKHNTGGGGGSNYTAGGIGGNELSGCTINASGGRGGQNCSAFFASNRLFLGGGGGSGDQNNGVGSGGAAGGGIIIIMAGSISGNAYLVSADGSTVTIVGGSGADGVGGGGAGGSIFINTSLVGSTFSASANGGGGGNQAPSGFCVGPGGGGGTGAIFSNLPTLFSVISSLVPGNAGLMTTGGAGCINTSYGATAGQTNTVGAVPNSSLYFTQSAASSFTLNIVSSNTALCSGNSVSLTVSGATNYTWLPMSVVSPSLSFSPPSTTNLSVVATTSAGCTGSVVFTQSVIPTPTLSIAIASTQICPDAQGSFTASGAGSYTWLPALATSSLFSSSYSVTTTHTLLGAVSNCTASTVFTQSVFNQPTLTINPSTLAVCSGSVFSLTAQGVQTYTWMPGTITSPNYTNAITAGATYSCYGTSVNGCSAVAQSTVSVKPVPVLNFNTFSITCGSLGSATVNASAGIGPYSYSWTPTAQTGPVASGLFPGVYSLTVFDAGTSCSSINTTTFFPLVPLSGTVSSTPSVACNGYATGTAAVQLAAGSGTQTYNWISASGTQTTPVAVNLQAGTHTLVVQDALTFCSITKTFVITQPTPLSSTLTPSAASVCLGGSLNYAVNISGGNPAYSYTWQTGSTQTAVVISETLAGTYVYTIQVQDANACILTKSVTAIFVPNPTLTVNSPTVCPLQTTTLQPGGAVSYTWSNGFVGTALVLSVPSTTVLSITGSALGCTATTASTVHILQAPLPTLSNNAPLCAGDSLKFSAGGGVSYLWSGPIQYTSSLASNTIANAGYYQTGMYYVTVTAANGCTAAAASSLVIYALPIAQLSSVTVCEGQALQLQAPYLAGVNYTWTGAAGSSNAQNYVIANSSPAMSGVYTLQTKNAFGCAHVSTVQAVVQNSPSLSFLGNTITCVGQSLQFLAVGATNYYWNGPMGFYSTNAQFSIAAMQPANAGTYSLMATIGACTVNTTKQFSVFPQPAFTTSITSPICENTPLMLAASGTGTFTWSGPANLQWFGQSAIFLAKLNSAGVYTCFLLDQNLCTSTQTLLSIVKPAPTLLVNDVITCVGAEAILQSTGAVTYTWVSPGGQSYSTSSVFVPLVNASSAGLYTVSTTGQNGCSTASQVVLSTSSVSMPAVSFTLPPYFCVSNFNTITAEGAEFYTWQGPANFSSSLASVSFFVKDQSAAGTYTLRISNKEGCSASYTHTLRAVEPQNATLLKDKNNICAPACIRCSLSPSMQSVSYRYAEEISANGILCFAAAKVVTVSALFVDTAGCSNTSSTSITIYEKPNADFLMSSAEGNAGTDEFYFYNNSSGIGIVKYLWIVGDSYRDSASTENLKYRFAAAGNFPIVLMVSNAGNCSDTAIKIVNVREPFSLYLPNAFTPNDDGINDVFMAKAESIEEFEIAIFNRWGQRVFIANSVAEAWDGRYRGEPCKADVYNWVLKYKVFGKALEAKSGTVLLLR